MNRQDKKIMRENRLILLENLQLESVLQYLVSTNILSSQMFEDIEAVKSIRDRRIKFLNILEKRGPRAFNEFKNSLQISYQENLFKLLSGQKILSTKSIKHCKGCITTQTNDKLLGNHCTDAKSDLYQKNEINNIPEFELKSQKSVLSLTNHIFSNSPIYQSSVNRKYKEQEDQEDEEEEEYELQMKDVVDGPAVEDLMIQFSDPQMKTEKRRNSYKMISSPRGHALLISIEQFTQDSGLTNREGGEVDVERLKCVLNQLKFVCHQLVDTSERGIWSTLFAFSRMVEHETSDCMFLIVMSHGAEGVFYSQEGLPINIEQMLSVFNNVNCPGLQNKPKIFLIQACRGRNPDKGTDETDGRGDNRSSTALYSHPVVPPESDLTQGLSFNSFKLSPRNKLPCNSDYFVGYGTVSGFSAMRNTVKGSWFIQAFVRVMARHAHDRHFLEIMTDVNRLVMKKEGQNPGRREYHRCKAMSESRHTFSKLLYFFPGL